MEDKHPTFLGKRLPNGIEGEPTRCFLSLGAASSGDGARNTYGVMICRQCHNTVHSIASNEVLALQPPGVGIMGRKSTIEPLSKQLL